MTRPTAPTTSTMAIPCRSVDPEKVSASFLANWATVITQPHKEESETFLLVGGEATFPEQRGSVDVASSKRAKALSRINGVTDGEDVVVQTFRN